MWQEPQNGDITVEEVLGFLRTSYQVQEAIAGAPIRVDWNGLATNTLLARLKGINILDKICYDSPPTLKNDSDIWYHFV